MNKLLVLSFTLASVLSFSLHAEEAKSHPCQDIKKACESAGFVKGDHKKNGKGLYIDCMQKVMAGESVAGVTVSAEQISSCKARREAHAQKKGANQPK